MATAMTTKRRHNTTQPQSLTVWLRCGLLLAALLMTGCTPSHTLNKSEQYARELGVIDQIDVSRWHNFVIPVGSKVMVAAQPGSFDGPSLSPAICAGIDDYLEASDGGNQKTITAARAAATKGGVGFLLIASVEDARKAPVITPRGDKAPDADKNPDSDNYSGLTLSLKLIDVVSGKTLDNIQLKSRASWFNVPGSDLATLLDQPLKRVAKDLTGVP